LGERKTNKGENFGHFLFTKHFKNKVRVIVKFKNDDAQVRNIRGAMFWQMLFAVKKELGIFSGDKSNITYIATQFSDYTAKGNIYWTAATVHNAVQDYRSYAPAEGIGLPPQGLKIFISRSGLIGNGGSTPMFAKRIINNISTAFATSYLSPLVAAVVAVVKSQLDMIIGYKYTNSNHNLDITQLLSDRIKATTYHELTHSAHYAALGNAWYTSFVNAEEYEDVTNLSSGYAPYGDGSSSTYSPIIALGEGWAYYMGHYLANKTYGIKASCTTLQIDIHGNAINTSCPSGSSNPQLDALENFNPNLGNDPFHWIPTGLFYDMMDNTPNETVANGFSVNDNVSGYTNAQMFNAFQSTVYTLHDYRIKLLQQTTNPTSGNVPNLFLQYGYQ
jgi:hypothetical protein